MKNLERVLVFGSHKGLGYCCVTELLKLDQIEKVLGVSRFNSDLLLPNLKYQFYSSDLTKAYVDEMAFLQLLNVIYEFNPTQIIYAAGGGPFGEFSKKEWKDHEWAIKLNFLFPAKLLWTLLQSSSSSQISKFMYIGSSIAESEFGDPMGPSYAAAKWGMKGLYKSLDAANPKIQFKWISPGYMDTDLLPNGSKPRLDGNLLDPIVVAKDILSIMGLKT